MMAAAERGTLAASGGAVGGGPNAAGVGRAGMGGRGDIIGRAHAARQSLDGSE